MINKSMVGYSYRQPDIRRHSGEQLLWTHEAQHINANCGIKRITFNVKITKHSIQRKRTKSALAVSIECKVYQLDGTYIDHAF